ncbi:MAG: ribonuclease P protein component [Spirochaetia bacterium]|nr:ribonuclease P protein component [Spirochaetia bacterium]
MKRRLYLKDYQDLIRTGKKLYSAYYLIYYKPNDAAFIKTGIKKKVGAAVERNYEKRVMRAVLNRLTFRKNWLILAILLKKSPLSFEEKKELLIRTCRPLLQLER